MKKLFLLFICLLVLCQACSIKEPLEKEKAQESALKSGLEKVKETDKFIYYVSAQDSKIIDDIDRVLEENYPVICKNLEYDYKFKIDVEIYPDQGSYDDNLSDKSVIGSPACSGNRKIQMVSPQSTLKIQGMLYKDRLLMAVHEFAHLVMNEIKKDAPMWLQEGVACFEGSKDGYDKILLSNYIEIPPASFDKLENSYYGLSYSDVYSYLAVKLIVERFGYEKLNQIIRQPEDFEKILEMKKDEFDREWNSFIQMRYGKE